MGLLKTRGALVASFLCASMLLQGCGQDNATDKQVKIQPAPKLTNDATTYAHAAWELMNQVDSLVYNKQVAVIEEQVRTPVRKLTTDWRVNVKMTDSVTEGKYALCRKALTSLDIWARVTADGQLSDQKKADYERDKQQCRDALEHPELGNTDPKKVGV
ncbi:hypothetical protein GFH30_08095 [Acinetobacter wanghuae]|uniref:Lipoprotein n=1 Tax=Acinetobacter wanghuae TaxID=2662362 RepID=A0A5Q0P6U9_9GAMM|nr:hypothetical protein [Acinetobacter wanghuae]MQW91097.1 hypothetical protein [Acinetobacter wanghuae]QGA12312.1 hypothetical protein GFH30_08095 [Acinetobacter wanghuae]